MTDLHEKGLTNPCPWAGRGQAQLVQRFVMNRSCINRYDRNGPYAHMAARNPRWEILVTLTKPPQNPKVNRILAQSGFRKIRAFIKIFSTRKSLVHHARTIQEDSYKERTSTPRKRCQPSTTIKAPISSQTEERIIYHSLALQSCENSSYLTFRGYLAGTTPVLSVRFSFFVVQVSL